MSPPPISRLDTALRTAAGLMNARRFAEARIILEQVVRAAPGSADAHHLLGSSLRALGDATAERSLRAAQAIAPAREDVAIELARLLTAAGRHRDAIAATEAAAAGARPREALLVERARAFKALAMAKESLAVRARIAALYPANAKAHHNLAAALGDAGQAELAEAAARAALARGGDAPETWLVLARALQSQNRFDEADAAFGEAVLRRPLYVDALRDRAQLVWMRTGDLDAAAAVLLDAAGAAGSAGDGARLRAVAARLFANADDPRRGYDVLVHGGLGDDPAMEAAAADLMLRVDAALALDHARRAERLAPQDEGVRRVLIDACLAVGAPGDALPQIDAALARQPLDQGLIAARWTAWRLLGDPRAAMLYDYEAMVFAETIEAPAGYDDLASYLSALAVSLRRLHRLVTHPLDQSLRHGTQTSVNLLLSDDAAIRAFRGAIDAPIRRYLQKLGRGDDVLRARIRPAFELSGMWSVKLGVRGFHTDHVHPLGWLSSAFYVALPEATSGDGREGWIKFGEPGIPTTPTLAAEHHVRPEPGRLVLFPSYMWHGTVPFHGGGDRLTLAFDVVPA